MILSLREQPKPSERMRLSKQQKRQKIDTAVEQNDTALVAAAKKNDEEDNLVDVTQENVGVAAAASTESDGIAHNTFQLLCTHTWLKNCKTPFLDLDEKIRYNLFILGYNLRTWHNWDIPPLFYSKWNTLKDYQQVAASELGYSESFWNEEALELSKNCSDAVHAKKEEEIGKKEEK